MFIILLLKKPLLLPKVDIYGTLTSDYRKGVKETRYLERLKEAWEATPKKDAELVRCRQGREDALRRLTNNEHLRQKSDISPQELEFLDELERELHTYDGRIREVAGKIWKRRIRALLGRN